MVFNSIYKAMVSGVARNMSTKAAITEPLSSRFHFFNFFEKPEISEQDFYDAWLKPGNYIKDKPEFVSMHLHKTVQENPKYPWVNFIEMNSQDTCLFGKPEPEWIKLIQEGFKFNFVALPAGYREISSLRGNTLDKSSKLRPDNTLFILTALRVEGDGKTQKNFEANWPYLSGSDVTESKNEVVDTVLYKKFWARPPTAFDYVTRTEINSTDVDSETLVDDIIQALEERTRTGISSFTSAYKIHHNEC